VTAQEKITQILTRNFFNVGVNVGSVQLTFFASQLVLREFGVLATPTWFAEGNVVWIALNVAPSANSQETAPIEDVQVKCNFCGSESLTSNILYQDESHVTTWEVQMLTSSNSTKGKY
jgi:hypothetical protein